MKSYDKPTADNGDAAHGRASFHDIQIQRLKRLCPEVKTSGCREAMRKAVCGDLRNMEEEEFNEQLADIRFVPDAYYIDEKKLIVYIYEVEVSNPITLDKMHKYVDLMWLLDNEEWGLLVIRVDKHGKPIPVDLFSWETDSIVAQGEKDKRSGVKKESSPSSIGWTAEEIERLKTWDFEIGGAPEHKKEVDGEGLVSKEKTITEQIKESSLGAFWRDSGEEVGAMVDAMELTEEEEEDASEIDIH